MPEIEMEEIIFLYHQELHENIPITYIALDDKTPVGSCTFQLNEELRPELGPWISDLVVDFKLSKTRYRQKIIEFCSQRAKKLGFEKTIFIRF